MRRYWPAFGFLALLAYQWRIIYLNTRIPAYSDSLEVIWGLEWFTNHFPHSGWTIYPLAFYPFGWQITTFAFSPTFFILLLPLVWMGGAAFAYNLAALLGAVICFTGMYRLCYETVRERWVAFAAAITCTFWPLYWIRLYGQLNLHLAFALLPWLTWALFRLDRQSQARRWAILVGSLWGLIILITLYGLWLGVIVVGSWLFVRWWQGEKRGRDLLIQLLIIGGTALLVALPNLVLYLYGSRQAQISPFGVDHAVHWGGSLNNLLVPYPRQAWLAPLTAWLYNGPDTEASATTLGLLPGILALVGLTLSRRQPRYRPFAVLFLAGILFSLGYLLRWNGEFVTAPVLEPFNRWLWGIGRFLKPSAFPTLDPPEPFLAGVPLPGYLPALFIPFWEDARTLSRFISIAGPGLFPLLSLALRRMPRFWQIVVGVYLVSQVLYPIHFGVPVQFEPHPAYVWLNDAAAPPGPVLDLAATIPGHLTLEITPPVLWGTMIHNRPAISGTSSSWPDHVRFLHTWLQMTPYDSEDPLLIHLLHSYGTPLILFHQRGASETATLAALQNDNRFHLLNCFDPPSPPTPWNYPICIFEVAEATNPAFNVLTAQNAGWFQPEPWGVWAEGTLAWGTFTALAQQDHRLTVELIPHCVPGEPQSIMIRVGDTILAQQQWDACETWQTELIIPASLVQVGLNRVVFESERAWRPVDVTNGTNPDARLLGFAAATLYLTPISNP